MPRQPDGEIKGGGAKGGPERWTGKGPRPARHIPWPELFKHHQSVLTGHLKMMDMVRKHCVEGTGNYHHADSAVRRIQTILRDFKESIRNFAPPRDNIDRVPLGASSASMYPGYSPADHIYGEAAAEYGQAVSEARRQGKEIARDPNGIEYVVGQSSRSAKEQIEDSKRQREFEKKAEEAATAKAQPEQTDPMEGVEVTGDVDALFTIDSNPTPVAELQKDTDLPSRSKNKANDKAKRRVSFPEDQSNVDGSVALAEAHRKKKAKTEKSAEAEPSSPKPLVEQYDPTEEVDERLAKKKNKKADKEKKRKRQSDSSTVETGADLPVEELKAENSKKKNAKKAKEAEAAEGVAEPVAMFKKSKKEKQPEGFDETAEPVPKSKKSKTDKKRDLEVDADAEVEVEEKPKKKQKKEKTA